MEVVKVQKVSLSFGSTDTQKDGTLSGFTTLGQIVPFTASAEMGGDSNSMAACKFDVEITSTSNVRASRGGSGVTATVIVYVVEFASDVTVYKGSWEITSGNTTDDNTISAVTLAEAFCWHFHKSAATAQQPTVANTASELQSTTNVRIHVNTSGQTHSGHYYVVEHSDLTVQRGSFTSIGLGTPAQDISAVTMADSFTITSHISQETQYEDEGNGYGLLASTTTYGWHMGYTEGDNTVYFQVVEDSDLVVQRFATRNTSTASGDVTITSVADLAFAVAHASHMIASGCSAEYDDAYDLSCRCTSYDLTTKTNVAWAKDSHSGSHVFEVIEFKEYVAAGPVITDVGGDEDIHDAQLNVVIAGSSFGASDTGSADVEIGDNATYASCTYTPSQSRDSWSATSIQVDISKGSLSFGTNYLFVTDSAGVRNATGFSINLYDYLNISSLNKSQVRSGQTLRINGEGFHSSQGSSFVRLTDGSTDVNQTIDTWTDTYIDITVVQGALDEDDDIWVRVDRNVSALGDSALRESNEYTIDLLPPVMFELSLSTQFINKAVTTRQLSGSEDVTVGQILESSMPDPTSVGAGEVIEHEFCLKATTDAVAGQQYEFRIKDEWHSGDMPKQAVTPKITITP